MTPAQMQFLQTASRQAAVAGHVFPKMAACEAALESGFGTSGLALADNNLFGMKQHAHPIYGTHVLPTKEFIDANGDSNKEWVVVNAAWVKYPDLAACFADRMATLRRLAPRMQHYAAALAATDPVTFVNEVSKSWSTDPERAAKVVAIYNNYLGAGV